MSVNGVWKGDKPVHGFNPGFKGMPGHVHHPKQREQGIAPQDTQTPPATSKVPLSGEKPVHIDTTA